MNESDRDKLAQETHQALLGIPGTEDKGLVGDFKEMKGVVEKQGTQIEQNSKAIVGIATKLEERSRPSKKTIGMSVTAGVGIIAALFKSFLSGN